MLQRIGDRAGVPRPRTTSGTRSQSRSCATGGDLLTLQQLLGHESLYVMVKNYVKLVAQILTGRRGTVHRTAGIYEVKAQRACITGQATAEHRSGAYALTTFSHLKAALRRAAYHEHNTSIISN